MNVCHDVVHHITQLTSDMNRTAIQGSTPCSHLVCLSQSFLRTANGQPGHMRTAALSLQESSHCARREHHTAQTPSQPSSSQGRSAGRLPGKGTRHELAGCLPTLTANALSICCSHRAVQRATANGPSIPCKWTQACLSFLKLSPAPWVSADELGHARLSFRDALKAGRHPDGWGEWGCVSSHHSTLGRAA